MALGIDIYARYQNVTNWQAVKNHGVGYVWVKLTDGGGKAVVPGDGLVAGAKSVGIPVGGYHYAQFSPTPERQAEIFIAEIRRLGATGLVPALDLEAPFGPNGAARDFGIRFCRRVAELGFRPGVYMNNAFAKATRPDGWGIAGLAIWLARYGARPDASAGHYDVHQYSSSGQVPGISGSVDLNDSYTNNHFAGNEDDEMQPDERNALMSTWSAMFTGGGENPLNRGVVYVLKEIVDRVAALEAKVGPEVEVTTDEERAERARALLAGLPPEVAIKVMEEETQRRAAS
ncbi:glycoside hydrolase family 25 protein [Amycolatopsis nigrescens]|uniref:glycoside hydrolase family 25 protein n=1 Tax=Amycolatopsis nigrescens TaxID=381445 RepID=UPI0003626E25|nr:glycoside hydrolase family 25 protein [Amycolatopsis nigrescens]